MGDNLLPKLDKESQKDSILYYLGEIAQKTKQVERSIKYFSQIRSKSIFYPETALRASYGHLQLGNYAESEEILNHIPSSQLKDFELAGLSLLKRDYQTFSQLSTHLRGSNFSKKVLKLHNLSQDLQNVKKRSPLVAGLLSAFIPGLGKGYAGEWRQMWGSFLSELLLGAQTWEAYQKEGVKSVRFIIYAGLWSIFHIGNIWGSTFTVKLKTAEQYHKIDKQIVFELKFPVK